MADDSNKRRRKKKEIGIPSTKVETTKFRKCEKAGCPAEQPECFSNATESCCGKGYTSRWYHMTDGEHFCNECFDHYYRSHKDGYKVFDKWRREWNSNSQIESNIKIFMAEQILPYWIRCNDCDKWRQYPLGEGDLTKDKIKTWTCRSYRKQKKKKETDKSGNNLCGQEEDDRVWSCVTPVWYTSVAYLPLLKWHPAAPLLSSYYLDGVGLSPIDNNQKDTGVKEAFESAQVKPFNEPDSDVSMAWCFRPDVMEDEELRDFPEFGRIHNRYLALRNLILTLWNINPKEVLTLEKCVNHLVIRGLVRIAIISQLERILEFLTAKGYVNFGLIKVTPRCPLPVTSPPSSSNVIVIGAGASGIATAKQLTNFRIQVTVLEARDRIGGRVCDQQLSGVCVGKGAQIMNGCTNNPLALMIQQCGLTMQPIGNKCDLIEEDGRAIDAETDERVEFHFNALLDAVADWRRHSDVDCSLGDKLLGIHKMFVDQTDADFIETSDRVLQFHFGNLEYCCATVLDNVSALNWDQNETLPQFAGTHTTLPQGYGALVKRMAEGLDIRLNTEVTSIDYTGDKVIVTTKDGTTMEADKVVVTVPLALLKSEHISFTPALPEQKIEAIGRLGAGLIEKIILSFSTCFWEKHSKKTDSFGHVPSSKETRGFCGIFYDLSPKKTIGRSKKATYVLMTVLAGKSAIEAQSLEDNVIVDRCMTLLRSMFPDKEVPEPVESIVTRWGQEPFSKMAYSYVGENGSGLDYVALGKDIMKKVYFAGEATNRQFPQTVTGAYLSGTREAYKIQTDLHAQKSTN